MSEPRFCLRCWADLSDVMGVQVFVSEPPPREVRVVPGLLCVEHGKNGANTLKAAEYEALVAAAEEARGMVVVRIVGLAGGQYPTPLDGMLLVDYDPTRPGVGPGGQPMRAHIEVTTERSKARRFPNAAAAHACWTAESGPENRPLTAYSVDIGPAIG